MSKGRPVRREEGCHASREGAAACTEFAFGSNNNFIGDGLDGLVEAR